MIFNDESSKREKSFNMDFETDFFVQKIYSHDIRANNFENGQPGYHETKAESFEVIFEDQIKTTFSKEFYTIFLASDSSAQSTIFTPTKCDRP